MGQTSREHYAKAIAAVADLSLASTLPVGERNVVVRLLGVLLHHLDAGEECPPLDYNGGVPEEVALATELAMRRQRRGATEEERRRTTSNQEANRTRSA